MKTSTTPNRRKLTATLTERPDGSLVDYTAMDHWIASRLRLQVVVADSSPMVPVYGAAIERTAR